MNLLDVKDLKTYFFSRWGTVKAVDGVSFSLREGETLGLVGESGSGKSITCLSILKLVPQPAGRIVGGQVLFQGEDLIGKSERQMQGIRGSEVSMIVQDPMTSLNPVFTVGNQLKEAIRISHPYRGKQLWEKAVEMLKMVGIASPERRLHNYPHQMSGGMKQRCVAAIALSRPPKLLIADEPTTSLDATIQVQFLRLLHELQQETGLALIFVTHDFGVVARMCSHVAVMYAGKIVEKAEVGELFDRPLHPYTIALMQSLPKVEERVERLASIEGEPPRLYDLPEGCAFFPRCAMGTSSCHDMPFPRLVQTEPDHWVACWRMVPQEQRIHCS
jgi:oligopeptide/dipeptide ABC transporter ATP-binding protein